MTNEQVYQKLNLSKALASVRFLIETETNPKDKALLYDALQSLLMVEAAKKYDEVKLEKD